MMMMMIPMFVTLLGMVTAVSDVQSLKAAKPDDSNDVVIMMVAN